MTARPRVALVLPALNEEVALPLVLADVPADCIDHVVVVDNGSTDATAAVAAQAGATVVHEPRRGYGSACLAGIAAAREGHDVLAFLDADRSDHAEDLRDVLAPVFAGEADLVIGSRMLRRDARRALLPQARMGNWLAAVLMRLLFGIRCTDLGPMRAIRTDALDRLGMADPDFGWTVEMQLRAHLAGLRVQEVAVRYRERIGTSKITGTVRGSFLAGKKILGTIFGYRLRPPRLPRVD